MAIFNGTNLGVYIGGTIIAAAQDVSMSLSMETIDITTKDSAGYRELLAGLRSGSMSCNGLIDYADASNKDVTDLYAAWESRTELTLKFSTEQATDTSFEASGFLTSLEQSGGTEDTATYSATFELTGQVTDTVIT
jgi:TP901-1 family phage major tail protein